MNANTYVFVRYGQQERGLRFDTTTGGSFEQEELLFGWLLNY
jgi:hypothetical protein